MSLSAKSWRSPVLTVKTPDSQILASVLAGRLPVRTDACNPTALYPGPPAKCDCVTEIIVENESDTTDADTDNGNGGTNDSSNGNDADVDNPDNVDTPDDAVNAMEAHLIPLIRIVCPTNIRENPLILGKIGFHLPGI
jgi:hypothetical protein